MALNLLDITRGENSLFLLAWLRENRPDLNYQPLWMKSGFGEPDYPWSEYLEKDILELWWGWKCENCGRVGDDKDLRVCPDCGSRLEPKQVNWGGIHDWKKERGRLTFRYSVHPF